VGTAYTKKWRYRKKKVLWEERGSGWRQGHQDKESRGAKTLEPGKDNLGVSIRGRDKTPKGRSSSVEDVYLKMEQRDLLYTKHQ